MKKTKSYLVVSLFILLSIFFVKTNKVSASTCAEELRICVKDAMNAPNTEAAQADCIREKDNCEAVIATQAVTNNNCADKYPGYACMDSTGKSGCYSGLCSGGASMRCCPPSVGLDNGQNVVGVNSVGCENGEKIGGVCFPTGTGLSDAPISAILEDLFSWLMALFTTLAVMAFVVSGVQYLTAAGNEDSMEAGKRNVQYSMLGILVGLSGFVVVRAIAAALSGTSIFF